MLLTDFCNRSYVTCTCYRSLDSRCARPTFAVRHDPTELPPPDTPGRFAFDDANRASVDPSLTRSAIWRSRASLNPGGLRYRRALEGTPLVPRRCLPRARSARRPLTPPVATCSTLLACCPPPEPPFPRIPSRTLTPRDSRRLPSTSAHSTRPPPFRRDERISNASPPPVLGLCRPSIRLPTLFRRLAPWREMARPRPLPCALHARALLATRRSSTSAIETICKHDRRTSKPDDTGGRSTFTELLVLAHRSSFRLGHRRFYTTMIQSKGSRGFTGQGPWIALQSMIALPASSAMIAHREGFAPTRSARTPHVAPPASTTIGAP